MENIRIVGIVLVILAIALFGFQIIKGVYGSYEYNKEIEYAWELADKSSSLTAKADYLELFINNLEKAEFAEYNAIWLKTPDNNVQNNINAVKTLRDRLKEIKNLDPESFAYQTAIQQITEQEQGEAGNMMGVIWGGWLLENGYWMIWDWYAALFVLFYMGIGIMGIVFIAMGD